VVHADTLHEFRPAAATPLLNEQIKGVPAFQIHSTFPTTPSEWSLRCATNALFYAGELVTDSAAEIELDAGCC
jgi:hypothetical protein